MKVGLAFFQTPVQGDAGTQCADVVLTPNNGTTPLDVDLYTPQTGGVMFYRISNNYSPPVHNGDNAVSPTVRIGTNHQVISIGSGPHSLRVVCYQPGFLDSNITDGAYDPGL